MKTGFLGELLAFRPHVTTQLKNYSKMSAIGIEFKFLLLVGVQIALEVSTNRVRATFEKQSELLKVCLLESHHRL